MPWEGTGAYQFVSGRAIGVDSQGQGRPHRGPFGLHEGRVLDQAGGGNPGAASSRLGEPDEVLTSNRFGPENRVADRLHLDPHSPQADKSAGNTSPAALTVPGDLAILHVDPGAQVIREPGALWAENRIQVLPLVGRRIVVVRHP